ncbi:hypothetical protein GX51_00673 [Blastomyces parvus]|uniref:Uncharacterized protein n=1 Tax=Blastomyces parvus TaxID=2060905 RepID=A0A2B7XLX6_9EURO|nr:hypothetical protein GX51_00673 [Blastomyces parvus]
MSDPKNYTVGWICAISTEYVAAQAFLDEKHEGPEYLARHDKNDYTLGRMGKHNVAIAVLPMGEYGTVSAARVAEDLIRSFPNIRIGLMVGIGGGAPSEKNDIHLGDLVISMPSNNGQGGVIQYDFGKTIQCQSFQPTGFLNQPPTILRAAVNGLNAEYELDGHQLKEKVNAVLTKKPRLQKRYRRPTCDRLYQSHVVHPVGSSCAQVCGDDEASLVRRKSRFDYDDDSAIHHGLIASGNQLMKDALIRDRLAAEKDVLCFEMEAAGLTNHFPCLVIRGICDYSDTHKNNDWQGYAAMVAAAYAKDLLCRIVPQQVEAEMKIQETLNDIRSDLGILSAKVDGIVDTQYDDEQEKILTWLTSFDFGPLQNDLISRKQEGTGEWLVETSEYQQWETTRGCTLFCPGIPGAGKTMTASFVIDHLRRKYGEDKDVPVIFIYCNYKKQQEMRPIDIFSSLLKQLSRNGSGIPESVMTLYKKHKLNQSRPSLEEVLVSLQSTIRSFSKTFIIADALDEYETPSRSIFMKKLFDIIEKTDANLLATSRFVRTVEAMFEKKNTLSREIQALPADLDRFVDGNVHKLPPFVLHNSALQDVIKHEIIQAASGMFLLAQLHLESLCGLRSPKAIKLALKNLRKGVDAYDHAYHEAMQRIKTQVPGSRELAIEALSWIILAQRPLSVIELLHALAVEVGESTLDEENISDVDHLVSVCVGLVTVDNESQIVRLVHYTAQEYFQKSKDVWFPHGHDILTRKCVTYLTFDAFSGPSYHYSRELDKKMELYPLFDYSARNWGHHAHLSSIDGDELISKLLENSASVSACNQAMMWRRTMASVSACIQAMMWRPSMFRNSLLYFQREAQGVHLAAFFGLPKTMEALLNKDHNCDFQDPEGRTVLSYAAEGGHEDVVKILLDRKASIDIPDRYERTPLHHAASGGHTAVLNLLLDRGAFVDLGDVLQRSPLGMASEYGHADAIRLLLDRQADVNHRSRGHACYPLSIASYEGHTAIVQLLLERGAFIDCQDQNDSTPLSWATINCHETVVKVLLSKNANATIKDMYGRTPLFHAISKRHFGIATLLLDYGSNVDTPTNDGVTHLMRAIGCASHLGEYFFDGGEPFDIQSDNSDNHTTSELILDTPRSDQQMLRFLLERGADVNIQDHKGCTALSLAARRDDLPAVRLLLEQGADVNIQDREGYTALSLAAWKGDLPVIKLLLKQGANVNIQDREGCTALSLAVRRGDLRAVRLLLEQGADVNIQDREGCTALSLAAWKGDLPVIKLLLERGADVNIQDCQRRTALSMAAEKDDLPLIEILFEKGADISQMSTKPILVDCDELDCDEEDCDERLEGGGKPWRKKV